ncbi:MAG: VanZ family protein [Candidatus Hydrogenedentes bacterium]|nr:VanZ family protein [Candidatus Hydrogenedentota bacterium]
MPLRARYVLATLIYCAAIFWESSLPQPNKTGIHFAGDDKAAHMLLYGGLAAVVSVGIRRSGKPVSSARQFFAPILLAAVYGVSDEFHQSFVPMRTSSLSDVIANTAGAALMQLVLCRYVWKIRLQRGRV